MGDSGVRKPVGRFPFPAYPNGWFRVAYADELAVGQVKGLHYFGQDLVAFRDEDCAAHVLDAPPREKLRHLAVRGGAPAEPEAVRHVGIHRLHEKIRHLVRLEVVAPGPLVGAGCDDGSGVGFRGEAPEQGLGRGPGPGGGLGGGPAGGEGGGPWGRGIVYCIVQ